jgi:hypothetical protein
MATKILSAALALALTACGGGGSDSPPTQSAQATAVLVLGNSLSVHPVDLSLGWDHVSGMAASDAAHDFVHLVAAGLGATPTAINIGQLELTPVESAPLIPASTVGIDAHTAVVIQLGDNGGADFAAGFPAAYSALLDATAGAKSLTCVSTWRQNDAKDALMKAACEAHQGTFVYIGDIFATRTDVIPPGENAGVASHPHDASMAVIAARLSKAV